MTLPKGRSEREYNKFRNPTGQTVEKETCIAVCNDDGSEVGTIPPAATGPMLPTIETVTDTSAAFPTTNQVGRLALNIRNSSSVENVYVVRSTGVTKASQTHFWTVGPNESLNTDFDDTNKIILVADAGKTVDVEILEIKA